MLNNFWQWSGGFAQYIAWAAAADPVPATMPNGSWDRFQKSNRHLLQERQGEELYDNYIQVPGPAAEANPTVIWELANEPRGMKPTSRRFHDWVDKTARLIKSCPGRSSAPRQRGADRHPGYAGVDPVRPREPGDRFICFHMWAENWKLVHGDSLPTGYPKALDLAKKYVNRHPSCGQAGEAALVGEFGFPRDGGSFDPASPTTFRDRYFQEVYALVSSLPSDDADGGIMPWAGGATRGRRGRVTSGSRVIRSSAIHPTRSRGVQRSTTRTRR